MPEITEKEVADFYDNTYYKSEMVHAIRPLGHYQKIFKMLCRAEALAKAGRKILDVGCGTGLFLKAAAEAGLETYGIDISQKAVEITKRNMPEAVVIQSKGEDLPFENKFFDDVFYGGTLEHFLDVDRGLDEGVRVAKDDAKFMIIVPNKNYWLWKMRGTYGTHQSEIKELLLTYSEWVNLFNKHGLKIQSVYQDPWPWDSVKIFKHKNLWQILRRAIYRLIWLFVPLKSTYQFVFICSK